MIRFAPPTRHLAALLACISLSHGADAAPFEVAIAPSRFELSGKNGARIGQALDIQNVGTSPTEVAVRTIDWSFSEDGTVTYHDALQSDSCRTWVTLERPRLRLAARERRSFRFQVEVPADAPRRECRFMLAVEGVEPAYQAAVQNRGVSLSLPVTGRIAVAVYLSVGGAAPRLSMLSTGMREQPTGRTPVVTVRNDGDAHGRLGGSLDAVDARGRALEWVPESTPILPGQTRTLVLTPRADGDAKSMPRPDYPVKASGTLDWEDGSFKVEADFR
ncbi:hypothetical protein J2W27_004372 [Variovorax boronicumulans]|uniref:hypothetical protein n=1 Tax=Variovorax boronicumulans TaxID=436515 RepID=UPI002787B8B4|nr:hypothetical protein [Variovorax boronicumulans]MDP9912246.1 hypothetical protein [Variovorax boronicumulans]